MPPELLALPLLADEVPPSVEEPLLLADVEEVLLLVDALLPPAPEELEEPRETQRSEAHVKPLLHVPLG